MKEALANSTGPFRSAWLNAGTHAIIPRHAAPLRTKDQAFQMNNAKHPPGQSEAPSAKLSEMLNKLTPAEREKAIKVAAALLNKRAEREAKGGTVDLTKKA